LGEVALRTSKLDEAAARYQEALGLFRQIKSPLGEANCIHGLGEVALQSSKLDEATERYQEALGLFRQAKNPLGEANCIRGLGEVALQRSQPDKAQEHLREALQQYERLPDLLEIGKVHKSLARIAPDAATRKQHIELALDAWNRLGNKVLADELLKEFPE